MSVHDTGPSPEVTLTWPTPAVAAPQNCLQPISVTLTDLVTGTTVDMQAVGTYTYTKQANPETRDLVIRAGCLGCLPECTILDPPAWQMATIPGDLCGACADGNLCCALDDDLAPFFLFWYDPTIGGYVQVPPCDAVSHRGGMGFWVRTYDPLVQICADVAPIGGPRCVQLGDDWNQIGNPHSFNVRVADLTVRVQGVEVSLTQAHANGWVSQYLFAYDPVQSAYVMLDP